MRNTTARGGDKMDNKITLDCSCGCSTLVIERHGNEYIVSIQSSYLRHMSFTLWGRIKSALKVLFGHPIYYADVYVEDNATMHRLLTGLEWLVEKTN